MLKKPTYEELEQRIKELEKEAVKRKRAEKAVQESEERYRDLYENAPNAYFSVSVEDGSILRCNTAALNLLGYDKDTLMEMNVFDLYANTSHGISKAQKTFKHFRNGESIRDVELQMKHKDGYPIWVSLSIEPVLDRNGNVTESRSMVIDITDHKRAENALLDREATLKQAQRLAHMGSWEWNLVNNSFQMSDEMCRIYGIEGRNQFDNIHSLINAVIHPDDQEMIRKAAESVTADFAGGPLTYRIIRPDGEIRWITASHPEVRRTGKDGKPEVMIGAVQDITERKRAQEALSESEEKYHSIFENIQDVYYEATLDGIILEVSPSIEEVSHYKREEIIGKSLYDIYIDPGKRDKFVKELLKNGKVTDYEILLKDKDGSQGYCSTTAKLVSDQYGNPAEIVGSLRNINRRKQMEEALRESAERYRTLVESTSDAVLMLDVKRRIVSCNRSFLDLFGYGREEVEGKSVRIIHQSDESFHALGERLYPTIKKAGTCRTEWELMRKDGDTFPVETVTSALESPDGSTTGYVAIIRDITERKLAEKALRHSEAQKKAILDASIDSLRYVDKDMKIIWANKTAAMRGDMSPEELVGQACHKVFIDRETPCEGCPTVRARETGKIERAVMYQPKAKGVAGGSYWDNYSVPLKNRGGDIVSFIQIARNITDEKQAMDALRESEETLDAINASSPVGIALVRKRILDWTNKAMYHMLGYEEGSLLGETARVLYPDDEEYDRVGRVLYPGIGETGMGQTETRLVKKDGSIIHCYIQMCALNPSDPDKGVIVAVMDITGRKLAEEHIHTLTQQLMKAQENERQMISRELHDRVGQDLSTLRIGLDTLIDNQTGVLPETRQRVAELSKMLQDSIMVIRDLSYDLRPPSLDQLGLVRTILQYAHDFSEKTGLSVDFTSAGMDHLRLNSDTEINLYRLIQEGLNNISKHARANSATIRLIASFPNIILRIEDDGKGFDLKKRLVTAQNEKRMGLGTMEERVSLLNGAMRIQSRPGKGTKVLIEVPYEEKKSES